MIELYNSAFSTCSQKVRLCLHEKGVGFVDRQINFSTREHLTPEYLALNPNGVVPTLVVDGSPVIDSSVICEYLEETFDGPALMPSTALGRAEVRAWMRYIEEVPTTAVRPPSFNGLFSSHMSAMSKEEFGAHAERLPLRKHFYLKMREGRFPEAEIDASIERLSQTIQRMAASLLDGPWLVGVQFTLADVILIPLITRTQDVGLGRLWSEEPLVADWFARAQARPSYDLAFYPGARITPGFDIDQVEVSAANHRGDQQ